MTNEGEPTGGIRRVSEASTVHLLPAPEAWSWRSTRVSVCGEPVTAPPPSGDDPQYCTECVVAASQWSAGAASGSAGTAVLPVGAR